MLNNTYSFILIIVIFGLNYFINYIYLKHKSNNINQKVLKNNSMGTLLILFGILKLINLEKFVDIYSKYDIITTNFKLYGYLFPFIEILIGYMLLLNYKININHIIILILMIISIVSVIISKINGQKLRCGCLGSFFHVPLSYVTIFENIYMIIMILLQYKFK